LLRPIPEAELAALGFHAQQAAEKAIEAVIVTAGLELNRTHDLAALASMMLTAGINPPLTLDELRLLNPFAVEFRYDEEIVPLISREQLADMLDRLMAWSCHFVETTTE